MLECEFMSTPAITYYLEMTDPGRLTPATRSVEGL